MGRLQEIILAAGTLMLAGCGGEAVTAAPLATPTPFVHKDNCPLPTIPLERFGVEVAAERCYPGTLRLTYIEKRVDGDFTGASSFIISHCPGGTPSSVETDPNNYKPYMIVPRVGFSCLAKIEQAAISLS